MRTVSTFAKVSDIQTSLLFLGLSVAVLFFSPTDKNRMNSEIHLKNIQLGGVEFYKELHPKSINISVSNLPNFAHREEASCLVVCDSALFFDI